MPVYFIFIEIFIIISIFIIFTIWQHSLLLLLFSRRFFFIISQIFVYIYCSFFFICYTYSFLSIQVFSFSLIAIYCCFSYFNFIYLCTCFYIKLVLNYFALSYFDWPFYRKYLTRQKASTRASFFKLSYLLFLDPT